MSFAGSSPRWREVEARKLAMTSRGHAAPRVVPSLPDPKAEVMPLLHALETECAAAPFEATTIRQVGLALLSIRWNFDVAARILSTLPASVGIARAKIGPFIAESAMEMSPTPECFHAVLAQVRGGCAKPLWKRTDLITIASEAFEVSVSEIKSARRFRRAAMARQVACFLCRKFTASSFPEIGRSIGGRDHTTILHASQLVDNLILITGIDGGSDPQVWARLFAEASDDDWKKARTLPRGLVSKSR